MTKGKLKPDYIHLKKKKNHWSLDQAFKGQSFPCWIWARMSLWAVLIYLTSPTCKQGNRNLHKVSSKYFLWCVKSCLLLSVLSNTFWNRTNLAPSFLHLSRKRSYMLSGSSCWRQQGLPGSCKLGRESGEAGTDSSPWGPATCTLLQCPSLQKSLSWEARTEEEHDLLPFKVLQWSPLIICLQGKDLATWWLSAISRAIY